MLHARAKAAVNGEGEMSAVPLAACEAVDASTLSASSEVEVLSDDVYDSDEDQEYAVEAVAAAECDVADESNTATVAAACKMLDDEDNVDISTKTNALSPLAAFCASVRGTKCESARSRSTAGSPGTRTSRAPTPDSRHWQRKDV